jgi:hypothetical protein
MLVLVVAVCAVSGLAAASASASTSKTEYFVEGAKVKSTAYTAGTGAGTAKLAWEEYSVKDAVNCAAETSSGDIGAEGRSGQTLRFTECHLTLGGSEPPNCGVEVVIGSNGTLAEASGEKYIEATLENSVLKVAGSSCNFKKELPIQGAMKCQLPEAGWTKLTQRLECKPSGAWKVYGSAAETEVSTGEAVALSGESKGKLWSPGEPKPHGFLVEGEKVKTAVTDSATRGATRIEGEVLKDKVAVVCTEGSSTGKLEERGLISGELDFAGCKLYEFEKGKEYESGCTVENFHASVSAGLAPYLPGFEEIGDVLTISSGATIHFLKACGARGTYPLEGEVSCALPGVQTAAVEHEVSCKPHERAPMLKLGGSPAMLETKETLKLTGTSAGKKWSAS